MPRKWTPDRRRIVGNRPSLPEGVVKSAGRVLQIFEFFDEIRREANVVEICAALGYPQSSTSVLLRSLTILGFLSYDRLSRMYVPTERVALLGSWVNDRLFSEGQLVRMMHSIHEQTGQAILLGSRSGFFAKYIYVIQATDPARLHITLGTERSLASSGTGFALLSLYEDEEIRQIVRAINAYAGPDDTLANANEIISIVAETRERGYAFRPDVVITGGAVIAMPLQTQNKARGLVVGVGGISAILREREDEIVGRMREAINHFLDGERDGPLEDGLLS